MFKSILPSPTHLTSTHLSVSVRSKKVKSSLVTLSPFGSNYAARAIDLTTKPTYSTFFVTCKIDLLKMGLSLSIQLQRLRSTSIAWKIPLALGLICPGQVCITLDAFVMVSI